MHKQRRAKNQKHYIDYFRKEYTFNTHNEYKLSEVIFESERWAIPELQEMKGELNGVKSLLNKYNLEIWSKHTAYRDPSSSIIKKIAETIQPELLTQAWCKFYEILKKFPILPEEAIKNKRLDSLHLCEAPGAFVCALNHYLVSEHTEIQLNWMANSLNPNYEGNQLFRMISDDRLIRYTLENWNFGSDFTGDITKIWNHFAITNSDFCSKKVALVTADGSINCMKDPGQQEHFVEHLHFCETVTALAVLKPGGTFVLKIFTTFEDSTINLLYLLNLLFEKVTIFKPCTSKSGNSEVYVINFHYKGFNLLSKLWHRFLFVYKNGKEMYLLKSMFKISEIPQVFIKEVSVCAHFFMENQIKTILDNIKHFEQEVPDNVQSKKWSVTKLFFQYHPINIIFEEQKLVPSIVIGKNWRVHPQNMDVCIIKENFIDRVNLNIMLDIKTGNKIDIICNSKFVPNNYLSYLRSSFCSNRSTSLLYQQVYRMLSKENILIDINDFDMSVYSDFQYSFFLKILHSVGSKNLIFIHIPLVTHFFVGLFYMLFHSFGKVVIWNGCIIFFKPDILALQKVELALNEIKFFYKQVHDQNAQENCDYKRDIIHLMSPSKFDESPDLVNLVWNYNSKIFAQRDMKMFPLKGITECIS